ncbi:hypothetical protein P4S72_07070 [Vibrio sp. PP-XX7]
MTTLKQLSTEQHVAFGTSGVRALVQDLTPRLCYAYTRSFFTADLSRRNTSCIRG